MNTAQTSETNAAPGLDVVVAILRASGTLERRLNGSLSMVKGITMSEYQLLDALRQQHKATATRVDLAAAVHLSPSGVTRALKPLEKMGFVTTSKDARDARRSLATLTEQGHELVADAAGVVNDTIDGIDALHALSVAEQREIAALLDRLS